MLAVRRNTLGSLRNTTGPSQRTLSVSLRCNYEMAIVRLRVGIAFAISLPSS
jgi:hypothetical protein